MWACPESEMGIVQPRQVQAKRVFELLRVSICGSEHESNYVARTQSHTAEFDVLFHNASGVLDRAFIAK
jgi:hypothetical protein